jgi:hypothetical protein
VQLGLLVWSYDVEVQNHLFDFFRRHYPTLKRFVYQERIIDPQPALWGFNEHDNPWVDCVFREYWRTRGQRANLECLGLADTFSQLASIYFAASRV